MVDANSLQTRMLSQDQFKCIRSNKNRCCATQNAYAISPNRRGKQLPDIPIRVRIRICTDISNSSRIHVSRQFYPALVQPAVENSDVTARHVGYWLADTTVRCGAAIFRVRRITESAHARERARSRFDPRMIIRRQVISGSRYTGRVMGKTVTLLSYPLWIHSIQPLFVRAPFLSACAL